ncbi:MAG: hypothetical protein ACI8P0_006320 [Planctomycetaceae bacterium]|jgi:hypothetical protein
MFRPDTPLRLRLLGLSHCTRFPAVVAFSAVVFALTMQPRVAVAETLLAGVAKVDITNLDAGPVNDPLYVKALVLKSGSTTTAIVTVDAVAIGGIGHIKDDYLGKVRGIVEKELGIPPTNVIANASHCHGIVCKDADDRTVRAIKEAASNLVPVKIGVGTGYEDRIMENRRLKMKDGRTIDVRHAYSIPPDEEIASVGPVDTEIGVLKLDRLDGTTLAVVYNFACHPIQNVPSRGNSADITGFASQVIEDNLSDGTIALFVQGCGGDINPIRYKDVDYPRDAEPLGNMLGLSTLKAVRKITTKEDDRLTVLTEVIALPRANTAERMAEMESEQTRLMQSLGGTSLNLKTFLPLFVKYKASEEFPANYPYRYLHDRAMGRKHLDTLDAENRANMERYIRNIHTMEKLTRLNTNLRLLKKHHAAGVAAGKRTIDVELTGLRIGNFVMTTFPGELTVQIGLNLKKKSPHKPTFIAGYTNGYIYYAPTTEQLLNVGGAQEDSDCVLGPDWQKIYEDKATEILGKL